MTLLNAAVAFTIPITTLNPGTLAITPDGNQVLATAYDGLLLVFRAPFSASSVPEVLSLPPQLGGIGILLDGSKALVTLSNSARLFTVSAPFGATSVIEEIPLDPVFQPSRDVAISGDGQFAVLAGHGGFATPDLPVVGAPFTPSGARVFDVKIPGGRGNGALRFAPPGFIEAIAVPDSSWLMKVVLVFGVIFVALFELTRLPGPR